MYVVGMATTKTPDMDKTCDDCGADPHEPCRPDCLGNTPDLD